MTIRFEELIQKETLFDDEINYNIGFYNQESVELVKDLSAHQTQFSDIIEELSDYEKHSFSNNISQSREGDIRGGLGELITLSWLKTVQKKHDFTFVQGDPQETIFMDDYLVKYKKDGKNIRVRTDYEPNCEFDHVIIDEYQTPIIFETKAGVNRLSKRSANLQKRFMAGMTNKTPLLVEIVMNKHKEQENELPNKYSIHLPFKDEIEYMTYEIVSNGKKISDI